MDTVKDLFLSGKSMYNLLNIAGYQIGMLKSHDIISEEDATLMKKSFVNSLDEVRGKRMNWSYFPGSIPLIICPNVRTLDFDFLLKKINIGGDPKNNKTFLSSGKIYNLCDTSSRRIAQVSCRIHGVGIQLSESNILQKYTESQDDLQMKPTFKGLMFSEVLMLSFYYPEIYDFWDGIQSLGSAYGKEAHILRTYWLNNKPERYLKIARENNPLSDTRFISPRVAKRVMIGPYEGGT